MCPGHIILDRVAVSVAYVFYINAVCTRFFVYVKCVHTQPDVFNRAVDLDVIFCSETREFLGVNMGEAWSNELYRIRPSLYTKSLKSVDYFGMNRNETDIHDVGLSGASGFSMTSLRHCRSLHASNFEST